MGRPKKEKPNHGKYYEIKVAVGVGPDGKLIRKSFYSTESREDAKKQAENYKISKGVAEQLGLGFIEFRKTFSVWADIWLETKKRVWSRALLIRLPTRQRLKSI